MVSPFFGQKIDEEQNEKDLRRKVSRFLVQMRFEAKQNEKTRSSPQASEVMVSHHNMVSLQMVSAQARRQDLKKGGGAFLKE